MYWADRVRRCVRSVVWSFGRWFFFCSSVVVVVVVAYCGKCYLKILCVVFDVATRTRQEESRNENWVAVWCGKNGREWKGGQRRQPGQLQQLGLQQRNRPGNNRSSSKNSNNGVLYAFLTWFNECREKHQQEKWNNCHWRHEKGSTRRGIWRLPVAGLLFSRVPNAKVRRGEWGYGVGQRWCGEAALLN